jgi:hypothetical protein
MRAHEKTLPNNPLNYAQLCPRQCFQGFFQAPSEALTCIHA